jgi:hypothetical protein
MYEREGRGIDRCLTCQVKKERKTFFKVVVWSKMKTRADDDFKNMIFRHAVIEYTVCYTSNQ